VSCSRPSTVAYLPSGRFVANAVWLTLAVLTPNLLRAAATLISEFTPRLSLTNLTRTPRTTEDRQERAQNQPSERHPHVFSQTCPAESKNADPRSTVGL
jgi:hypothetical protein